MVSTVRSVAIATLSSLLACHGCNDEHAPAVSPTGQAGQAGQAGQVGQASQAGAGDAPSTNFTEAGSSSGEAIHLEDEGKTIDANKGATVTFKLASNAGTGYVWVPMTVDTAMLIQQGDRTSEVATDTPGAPKFDVYRFTAGSAGSTVVEMSLKRPFGSAPPARAFHVTVNVH